MAKTLIFEENVGRIRSIDTDQVNSRIFFNQRRVAVQNERTKLSDLEATNYPISRITDDEIITKIEEVLPFRVRFVNLGIEAYGPENPPPVGVAVIGFNNYIL